MKKWGRFPGKVHRLRIQCTTPTQLATLMAKWLLNNTLTTYGTFYHLQQSPNGTSIQVKISGYPSGGLRCTLGSYIRKNDSSRKGENERIRGKNIKYNQELCNRKDVIIWVKAPRTIPRKNLYQYLCLFSLSFLMKLFLNCTVFS